MNFFAEQDNARRKTRHLTVIFILVVVLVALAVNVAVSLLMLNLGNSSETLILPDASWLMANSMANSWISLAIVAFIGIPSLYKIIALSSGGGKVARSLGGTLINADVSDPLRRRLYNVVEEMAIASSVPMPEVYVLEQEAGINAFAAGFTASDAAVTVTRGTLETLSRDELQGVIGHEFSHILNGDMRLNMRLMGFIFGISSISFIGKAIFSSNNSSSSSSSNSNSRRSNSRTSHSGGGDGNDDVGKLLLVLVLFVLALYLISCIGAFFGRLIKAGISRQREFLADASSVQFTRQTDGIAGALKKIAVAQQGSHFKTVDSEEVSHMLFATGASFSFLLATHPPIIDRIKALEPNFSPDQLEKLTSQQQNVSQMSQQAAEENAAISSFAPVQHSLSADTVTTSIGNPQDTHIQQATVLLNGIPESLRAAAYSQQQALPLVLSLLLDTNQTVRGLQLNLIALYLGKETQILCEMLQAQLQQLTANFRLPLLQMAFPIIKNRPPEQIESLIELVQRLIEADGVVDSFEFLLSSVLKTYLDDAAHPRRSQGDLRLVQTPKAIHILFSVFAKQGHDDADTARRAYKKAMAFLVAHDKRIKLLIDKQKLPEYTPIEQWMSPLDAALTQLDRLQILDKEALLVALTETVAHDGKVTASEAELFRAVCAVFHCPLPAFVSEKI